MSSEKQDKMPEWKQTLLQWEQSGGHTDIKEELLWNKLQEKLQPKKNRTMFILRAIAFLRERKVAAAMLVLLAVSLFFLLRNKGTVEKQDIVKGSSPVSPVKEMPVIESKKIVPVMVKQEIVNARKKKAVNPVPLPIQDDNGQDVVTEQSTKNIVIEEKTQPVIEKELSSAEGTVSPSSFAETTAGKPKRKLKIVHLNELNAPPPPAYASLKEEWRPQVQVEPEQENIMSAPSIWPGKNKPKPSISLGN